MDVMSLAAAAAKYPFKPFVLGTRTSSGFGRSLSKMEKRLDTVAEEIRRVYPKRPIIRGPGEKGKRLFGREQGYMNVPRPILQRGAMMAQEANGILVYPSENRFIRSATDRRAKPSEQEFQRLSELTFGVVLATVIDPEMNDAEQQQVALKRGGAGRKSRAREMKWKIFPLLGYRKADGTWAMSLQALADRIGVGKGSINRVLDEIVPEEFVPPDFAGDRNRCRWRDLPNPNEVFRTMELLGGPKPKAE